MKRWLGIMLAIFTLPVFALAVHGQRDSDAKNSPAVQINVPDLDQQDWDQQNLFDQLVRLTTDKEGVHGLCYRSEWLGKPLQVEGILWGNEVIHQAGSVALKRTDGQSQPPHRKYQGQLVRVTGVLRHGDAVWSRFFEIPPYFYIEPAEVVHVEKATAPFLLGRGEDKNSAPKRD